MEYNWITTLIIATLPILMAITLHEAAHGYAALRMGDPTAMLAGRVTLNPLAHIDPIGTLLMPALLLIVSNGAFAFGYARPVPVNFSRLRHPKRDMRWVAAAGPFANLIMALFWLLLQNVAPNPPESAMAAAFLQMCFFGVIINLALMILNLLPLPPLDGGRIVVSLLPMRLAIPYAKLEPFGIYILLFLLVSGILDAILNPLIRGSYLLLQALF